MTKKHWEDIYKRKNYSEVTWFQSEPNMSMDLIRELKIDKESLVLDVGAGSSTLVDCLISEGFKNISLLDISENAFGQTQKRLGSISKDINWIVGDIRNIEFNEKLSLWHDRAVFHFLTNQEDKNSYFRNLNQSLNIGSYFVISTFAEDGPLKCSGLEVTRYSKDELIERVGEKFSLLDFRKENHVSPGGMEQRFNYWVFKKDKE